MAEWAVDDELTTELENFKRVEIRIVSGEVDVTVAEGTPRLEVKKRSGNPVRVELNDGVLSIVHTRREGAGSLVSRITDMVSSGPSLKATVAVSVPPEVSVDIAAVSADVVVSGVKGGTSVKTVSGEVTLDQTADTTSVKTVSGSVSARSITGDVDVKAVSGSISLVNGKCRLVRAKTVSGDVVLDFDPDPAGTYDVNTVSGEVALRTPGEPSVVVDAASVSGSLASDFGIAWPDDRPGRRKVRARIGDGEARLAVRTVSGAVKLVRRPG